jgi:hypothetical protein
MLKKVLLSLLLVLSINNAKAQTIVKLEETEIDPNKIYFFAHSFCQECKNTFIFFSTQHADLNIPIADMKHKENFELYKKCVKKFDIKNAELRLPLICMGNNYIMGWDKTDEARFDQYLQEFQTK